jgi:hypothetical protein
MTAEPKAEGVAPPQVIVEAVSPESKVIASNPVAGTL